MKKNYSFLGSISEGKIILHNEKLFKEKIRQLKEIGLIELLVVPHLTKRTTEQNSLYWGTIVTSIKEAIENLSGETYALEEVHEYLRSKFCNEELFNPNNKEYFSMPVSSTRLSTGEFYTYMEECKKFALDFFGLDIEEIIRKYEKKSKKQHIDLHKAIDKTINIENSKQFKN